MVSNMGKYSLIYADPPWQYRNQSTRAATHNHYPTMTLQELRQIRVKNIADNNSLLAMWYTAGFSHEAQMLAMSWGFQVKTMKLFTWVKLNKCYKKNIDKLLKHIDVSSADDVLNLVLSQTKLGLGNYTRANSEDCLITVRGKPLGRVDKSISQIIYAPVSEHSEKPKEARIRLEKLYGDIPRIELFARQNVEGWHAWGNECVSDIDLNNIC